jgi:hypothetical protein
VVALFAHGLPSSHPVSSMPEGSLAPGIHDKIIFISFYIVAERCAAVYFIIITAPPCYAPLSELNLLLGLRALGIKQSKQAL